jgi:hypothetical protein
VGGAGGEGRREEAEEMLTDVKELAWLAMVRWRDPPGGSACRSEERGCGSASECEGGNTGAWPWLL